MIQRDGSEDGRSDEERNAPGAGYGPRPLFQPAGQHDQHTLTEDHGDAIERVPDTDDRNLKGVFSMPIDISVALTGPLSENSAKNSIAKAEAMIRLGM